MLPKILHTFATLLLLVATSSATAQSEAAYPVKPIHWIMPFAQGGIDLVARIVGQKASESLGQPFVIESRPGAGGTIGTAVVARSPADGYTLLMGSAATLGINVSLYASLPYDAQKDFAPVCLVGFAPNALIVNPKLAVHSVKELIDYASKHPGVTFSSPGVGSVSHMAGALFQSMAGVRMTHVPHKGTAEALLSVVRGDVDSMFANLLDVMPMIKPGRVRVLAVTTATRVAVLPELPTVAEEGSPGYEAVLWFGVFAPAGTPEKIVDRLANAFIAATSDPGVRSRLTSQGFELRTLKPAEFGTFVRSEIVKWGRVVKATGAKVE